MTRPWRRLCLFARAFRRPLSQLSLGLGLFACVALALGVAGCQAVAPPPPPSIEFTRVPEAANGGPEKLAPIAGRVIGARPGQRIVLFAKSGVWWVQPFADQPFTAIAEDGSWKSEIHLGTDYAALLVEPAYRAPETMEQIPKPDSPSLATSSGSGTESSSGVVAVQVVKGIGEAAVVDGKPLTFSGYEWTVRDTPSDRGGVNAYDAANAWTDAEGALHLKLARHGDEWTSAEVSLTRPLGYGTYVFVVRDTSQLDPAAAFSMLTWDAEAAEQNHRELDIEISRWGVPGSKQAQFVVQPYYVAANVTRFAIPPGRLTHTWRWEPGRASFKTLRGASTTGRGAVVAAHDFASGVPASGNETVRINLYYFRHTPIPLQKEAEVVIEKFLYLP